MGFASFCRIAALILVAPAAAQPATAQQLPIAFPAVGQITYGRNPPGAAICTGTLVAPDLVLTAGHCVSGSAETPMDPADIRFAAGWSDGQATALSAGREVIRSGLTGLPGDTALLRLATPIVPGAAVPLRMAKGAGVEGRFTTVAYRRDAPERQVVDRGCTLIEAAPPLLGLGCTVVSGNSGAPVLVWRGGAWQVMAVMVAQSRAPGAIRAIAVIPDPGLRADIPPP